MIRWFGYLVANSFFKDLHLPKITLYIKIESSTKSPKQTLNPGPALCLAGPVKQCFFHPEASQPCLSYDKPTCYLFLNDLCEKKT